jgi:acyl CoA:acetate/3-ketoacid CoA transferase alpha subunit
MNQAQFVTLAEAAASVPSGAKIAIGGAMVMSPMAFVR